MQVSQVPYRYQYSSASVRCSFHVHHCRTVKIRCSRSPYNGHIRSLLYIPVYHIRIFLHGHSKSLNTDRTDLIHAPRSCLLFRNGKFSPVQYQSLRSRSSMPHHRLHIRTGTDDPDPVQPLLSGIPMTSGSLLS